MPDETIVTPAVEAVTTEAAPVVEQVTQPVETTVEAPVVTEEAPVAETKPVETTVLGDALKTPEQSNPEATEEKPVVEETPKTDEGQSDEPAPPPVYEDFTVPEGVTLDTEQVKEFTTLLSDLELAGKADHAAVQEFGQKAVDFHVAQLKKATEDLAKFYQTTWEKQKTDWKESFMKDPEIGGNRSQTTLDSAIGFIRTHGGSDEQQAEFRQMLDDSGLGNHPAMIRLLANASRAMSEGRPLAAQAPPPAPKSKTATLYGKS